jgi:hypothetical protein
MSVVTDEPADQTAGETRIYLSDLAVQLGRKKRTIRSWVYDAVRLFELVGNVPDGALPRHLWPKREEEGRLRLYWLPEQVEELMKFADDRESRQGWQSQ